MAKRGRYECDGEIPIVVTDGGELPNGMCGPWVYYRFEWERDDQARPVLFTAFDALIGIGYRHVDEAAGKAPT